MTALRIVEQRPDYKLFENNCQNFARYLVEEISPGSFCPNTIKHVLEEWTTLATDPKRRLPGAYPNSIISTITYSGMYFTAREEFDDATSSSQRRIMSVFLDESASGILLILSDSNISVMTVSMNSDEEERMSESASGILLIVSDPNVSVTLTVSMESDDEDSTVFAFNGPLYVRGDQILRSMPVDSEFPGWDTSDPQTRFDMISPNLPTICGWPRWDTMTRPNSREDPAVELCDEFVGVPELLARGEAVLNLYFPGTDVEFATNIRAAQEYVIRRRYICVLARQRIFLLQRQSSPNFFSLYGELFIEGSHEDHSGPQRGVSLLFWRGVERTERIRMRILVDHTSPNMSWYTRYRHAA